MTSSRDDIIQHLVNGGATVKEAVGMLPMYDVEDGYNAPLDRPAVALAGQGEEGR